MSGNTSFKKAWEVLFPYLLYYLTYQAVYLILAFAYQASVRGIGGAYGQFMAAHAVTVAGAMGGLCMLIGILPLVPMLKIELRERRETAEAAGNIAALAVLLALSASLGLNALLTLSGFVDSSQTYQEVADRQYGVPFVLGLLLYGVISPLAEEVVFRGVIYNRLRRFYGPLVGIVASGVFFGAFHGNLVQGVYGACLGMLIAYFYERSGNFRIPILLHAVANLAVYTTARMEGVQEVLFSPGGCAVLLAVAAGCVLAERRLGKEN